MAFNSNGLYPPKAQTLIELNSSVVIQIKNIVCRLGVSFKEIPEEFDMHPLIDRDKILATRKIFSNYETLAIKIFIREKLLPKKLSKKC